MRARRRARRAGGLGRYFRGKTLAFVFIALIPFILTVGSMLANVIPEFWIYAHPTQGLGAGATLPQGATGISTKLLVGIGTWALAVFAFINAIRMLGIRL